MPPTEAHILPAGVRPYDYQIKLQSNPEQSTFRGEVAIGLQISQPTSKIVLNADELRIESATLIQAETTSLAQQIDLDKSHQQATLDFGKSIAPGKARLEIAFSGELNDKLRGFYHSLYTSPGGQQRYLAVTQFEATDARRAFPCWDEPACKAKFELTLIVPSDLVAISNAPLVSETPMGPELKAVRFAETPVMSTYLLAFAVGDFTHIEQLADNHTKISVWTTRGKEAQGRFALDSATRLLSFYNEYFGIPYPMEKLDHIALPDFAAGAMENWGAITYRETALLVDPQNSSAATRQRVAEVVAHEMAHMWFGDLVTMEWWDDLWLNESFASWMGTKAVDWLFPEWRMWTQFVNMDTSRALSLDGLENTHPIEQPVENPAEVSQLFDAISYSKGASVIRMLEQFLGAEVFRQGLNRYLSDHQYRNARTEDLWHALEQASGQPVASIMDTWTKQPGYPVIKTQIDRTTDHLELAVSQERFLYADLLNERPQQAVWRVPVRVSHGGCLEVTSLLTGEQEAQLTLLGDPSTDPSRQWVKVNPDQTAFYRVNYGPDDWDRLAAPVRSLQLPSNDRLGIQNDAYALSRAGRLPVTQYLALLSAYDHEEDASVWGDIASNLRDIDNLLADEECHGAFELFARGLFLGVSKRVGWDARPGEGHLDALLRSIVLGQVGAYGDTEFQKQASERFQRYLEDPASVHPNIRGVVFNLVGQTGDRSSYDTLWDAERRAPLQEEKIRLLQALTRFQQPDLLQITLERSLSSEVRSQDTITVVTGVASNLAGRDLAWEFLKARWTDLDRRYGGGGFGLMRLVSICSNFTTQDKLEDVDRFFRHHPAPAAERTIRQSLERIRLNMKWLEQSRTQLALWFGQ